MFRYGRMWHVFINHGESDKMYMTTNQFKAYDFSFVAGDAARDRLAARLWGFDLDERTRSIGRPQADHFAGPLPYTPDDRTVALYAPTWEGDRASAAYGSIATHGVALTRALLDSGTHRLIYRPHPRSGVADKEYRDANRTIIEAIERANSADPDARHIFDDGPQPGWQLAAADVATDIIQVLDAVQHSEEAQQSLRYWVERHFGDATPGVATERFHAAVDELIRKWEVEAAIHAGDAFANEVEPRDEENDES